ncbi:MAG: aminoacyl-tRNA hydrolase [Clostridia bacterium]|nr:aminoacyl-tRNA hydrolase [Clostridia bacterium]
MASIFDLFKRIEKKRGDAAGPPEFIAAGLGNPGKEYENTRHNAGYVALDEISDRFGVECTESKFSALCGKTTVCGKRVLLIKPLTYMNNSGLSVKAASSYYKIPPEKIIVFCDDVNFDPGKMRIREKGSDGGHNGLKSIIVHLSSDAFVRVKLGVGKKPSPDCDLPSWVLGKMTEEDRNLFDSCAAVCPDVLEKFVSGDISGAMSLYNKR